MLVHSSSTFSFGTDDDDDDDDDGEMKLCGMDVGFGNNRNFHPFLLCMPPFSRS
jgi:hypothetical protein